MQEIYLNDEKLKQGIMNLPFSDNASDNIMILIPESDYGFAKIYRLYDDLLVFLIPIYGGTPSFYKAYNRYNVDNLILDLKSLI